MEWSGIVSLLLIAALTVTSWWQYQPCIRALRTAWKRGQKSLINDHTPPACIVLCLRGSDPFLDRCLEGLTRQDYPDYQLMVVVDSETDEALPHVHRAQQAFGADRIQIVIRDVDLKTCTRKCSSLLSAYRRLSSRIEVVATCDGDAVTHPTWLRELVAPMKDPQILATSGNRWYSPPEGNWAGFARYYWNALAVPAMVTYRIAWGGSLAMRSEVFRDPEYLEGLAHAFGEDTHLATHLAKRGTRAELVIPLVLLNEEETTFSSLWGFLERQSLSVRLNHPAWLPVLANSLGMGVVAWIMLPLTLLGGLQNFLWGWLVPVLVYTTTVQIDVARFDRLVRRMQRQWHGRNVPRMGFRRTLTILLAPIPTGFLYTVTSAVASVAREHVWRGIRYRLLPSVLILDEPRSAVAASPSAAGEASAPSPATTTPDNISGPHWLGNRSPANPRNVS